MCAMTDDDGMRSLTVTDDLLRDVTRDVTAVVLRTRHAFVWWCLAVSVASALVLLVADGDRIIAVTIVVVAPLLVLLVLLRVRRSVRRALATALAPGSTVGVRVAEDGLHQHNALGSSQTAWAAYRDLRVQGSVTVLRLRGSEAVVVLPSALLTEADRATIRARLGTTAGRGAATAPRP